MKFLVIIVAILVSCQGGVSPYLGYIDLAQKIRLNTNIKEMTGHRVDGNTLNGKQIIVDADKYRPEMEEQEIYFYIHVLQDEAIVTEDYKAFRNAMIKLEIEQYLRKADHSVFITNVEGSKIMGYIYRHSGPKSDQVHINSRYTAKLGEELAPSLYKFTAERKK